MTNIDDLFREALKPIAAAEPSPEVWERIVKRVQNAPSRWQVALSRLRSLGACRLPQTYQPYVDALTGHFKPPPSGAALMTQIVNLRLSS